MRIPRIAPEEVITSLRTEMGGGREHVTGAWMSLENGRVSPGEKQLSWRDAATDRTAVGAGGERKKFLSPPALSSLALPHIGQIQPETRGC